MPILLEKQKMEKSVLQKRNCIEREIEKWDCLVKEIKEKLLRNMKMEVLIEFTKME